MKKCIDVINKITISMMNSRTDCTCKNEIQSFPAFRLSFCRGCIKLFFYANCKVNPKDVRPNKWGSIDLMYATNSIFCSRRLTSLSDINYPGKSVDLISRYKLPSPPTLVSRVVCCVVKSLSDACEPQHTLVVVCVYSRLKMQNHCLNDDQGAVNVYNHYQDKIKI
ncbi:hypothetical protein QTP88_010558 [Uroleucon formosanum]